MIKATVMFMYATAAHARMLNSMFRYLPEDIKLVNVGANMAFGADTILKEKPDILVSHYGYTTVQPFFAFISPKIIINELVTEQIVSYFTERDVMVVYYNNEYERLKKYGVNVILWPRPVDDRIFFLEDEERDIDVLVGSHYMNYPNIIYDVCTKLGLKMVSLTKDYRYPGYRDYCVVTHDDRKLRQYYNRAKYVVSFVGEARYGQNNEKVTHGFEVGYLEGVFCGATPILLDGPHSQYLRHWYGDYAKWVRIDQVEQDLEFLLTQKYEPLSKELVDKAVERYNARKIWSEFWDAVREVL